MSFRRYPERQFYPCTPFTEKQIETIESENGMVQGVLKETDLNHYEFPEGIREKYDLETAIASGENLRAVSSNLIESDLSGLVDGDAEPLTESDKTNSAETKGA